MDWRRSLASYLRTTPPVIVSKVPPSVMTTEFLRSEDHVHRHVAGEHLLIAIRRTVESPLFALTPTAAALWDRLHDWTDADGLVDLIVERFEVDRDQAAHDVSDFLEQLKSIGAVSVREV